MDIEIVKQKLYDCCKDFIYYNNISCDESIYQRDNINIMLEEFVSDICNIVGFYKEEDND